MAERLKTGAAKAVTTAGTAVQLEATGIRCSAIIIQALPANTGYIYVGDSTVASTNGFALGAEDSLMIGGANRRGGDDEFIASDIYIDSSVNGEGVTWQYVKVR